MIRRPDLHWPAAAGAVLAVLTAAGCMPASADSRATSTSSTGSPVAGAATTSGVGTSSATGSDTGSDTGSAGSPEPTAAVPPGTTAAPPGTASATRHTTTKPRPGGTATQTVRPGPAVITLATLAVKGRAPKTGYDRDLFGQAWADVDRNGCDTRNDILRRDLTRTTLKPGTRGCVVLRGTLTDPYTGTRIAFVRGRSTSNAVQIDHVVALSDAWQKGAQRWTTATRTAFANDPLNLLAVDGPTNLRKGDGDAATWLPPRKAFRCAYVARQVAVKHRYSLSVTAAERDAMVRVLTTCPGQALPR